MSLPDSPGVYIYYDGEGNVLYVGKAKNLKHRVKQYFSATVKQEKVLAMLSHMADFRYILTPTEGDAFSLENTLIKKYLPPYNILLKDDKQHSYIKINVKADFPKLLPVRKIMKDKAKYFGPVTAAKELMELISSIYPTVNCNYNFEKLPKNFRPCLNYHIGRCPAPCIKAVDKKEYALTVGKIINLLNGDDRDAKRILTEKMAAASEETKYEQALQYKRQLEILSRVTGGRIAELTTQVDLDVFAICSNGHNAISNVMAVRKGKVVMSDNHSAVDAGIDEAQTLTSFLSAYCDGETALSKEIVVNLPVDNELIEKMLSARYGRKITVRCPQKGVKKKLVNMSFENALEKLEKSQSQLDKRYNTTVGACAQLKEMLSLPVFPKRIECYDISNISGVDKVASMVVFTNGQKDNKSYRRFKIKTVEGANDFASMHEVLTRRMERLRSGDAEFGQKPDLIVVDGGLGQLEYARRAVGGETELVSLAKKEELVYTLKNNEPVRLPRNSYALNLLTNIRDEAHRFAITYFRQLHTKTGLMSVLTDIEGVGKKRQVELIRHFRNVENISRAGVDEIMRLGITQKVAQNIYDYFNK